MFKADHICISVQSSFHSEEWVSKTSNAWIYLSVGTEPSGCLYDSSIPIGLSSEYLRLRFINFSVSFTGWPLTANRVVRSASLSSVTSRIPTFFALLLNPSRALDRSTVKSSILHKLSAYSGILLIMSRLTWGSRNISVMADAVMIHQDGVSKPFMAWALFTRISE